MKKIFSIVLVLIAAAGVSRAQSVYQPYNYQFYQKLDADVYSTKTREHSSLKPYFVDDSILKVHYDSLMNYGSGGNHSWGYRKLFNEHLIDVKSANSTFYADVLPDMTIGKNYAGGKEDVSLVSYGAQIGGTVGDKFYYNVLGFEDIDTKFPEYISTYINQTGMIPGQARAHVFGNNNYDWFYLTAVASYTPVKFLNISAGRDRTFIGDGYRSVLLSDYSEPSPFMRLTATLGNVRYMAMWTYMNDPQDLDAQGNDRKKWGVFHYLDWNVSNRLSLGFFDSIIWYDKDDEGHARGFDVTYLNPITFLRPLEAANGSPDNALIGLTAKYKITDGITAYGQFALDEFHSADFFSGNGSSHNKYAYQFGFRGADMFGVKGLNYLIETNNATPYTYSERGPIINYTANGEPLAQPWGANYREFVGLLNYSYKRFDFSGEVDYGHYGLDMNGLNYGKDPFQDYTQPANRVPNTNFSLNNYIGQGLTTNMYYLDGKVAYLLNPKYNLRIELEGLYRTEKNAQFNDKTAMISVGIRSSFRALYSDLASYKTH